MPDKKLTDSEIVKALKELLKELKGKKQLIVPEQGVKNLCYGLQNFLDLINRLQAENEKLKIRLRKAEHQLDDSMIMYNTIKSEAYKECIEKVKSEIYQQPHSKGMEETRERYRIMQILDNLLKELKGTD